VNLNRRVIDGPARSRYSQGQIKDLVAYANPQPQMAAQSFGSPLRRVPEIALQPPAFSPAQPIPAVCASIASTYFPGGSARGSARFISPLQRRIGGYRHL
jgi:hypothetical protein